MNITILREEFCPTQLDRILVDCGHSSAALTVIDRMADVDFDQTDVLVVSMDACNVFGMLNGRQTCQVPDFVNRGGICWILHQEREGWDASWLPLQLRQQLHIDLKYLPKMIAFRPNTPQRSAYIGPWFLDRNHQIFQRPHFIDEEDFAEWKIDCNGTTFQTTALNVITRHTGWQVLAGYEDIRTSLEDGALILQAQHGKGLYFWSQLLSPGLIWHCAESRERKTWTKLIINLLTYFREFKAGETAGLNASISPWSVKSGEEVTVNLCPDDGFEPASLRVSIVDEAGENITEQTIPIKPDSEGNLTFGYPIFKSGTCRLRSELTSTDGRTAIANQFVKVFDNAWRCRFTIHHHYCNDWVTEHLGQVFGSARRWKLDALFLASGLFYQSLERYQIIDEAKLRQIDQPALRIFPGQEIHPHHQYGLDEGNTDVTHDSRRHLATMGCSTIICDANYFENDTIARIHDAGGLAIVAHANPGDPWWTTPYQGHCPDGVCVEKGAFADWDKMLLRKKRLFPAVRGSDSGPGEWSGGNANTTWLREPLSMRALMKAAINGRISFLYPEPGNFSTAESYLWFDICGQRMGGTLYASDSIQLHLKAEAHLLFRHISIIVNGKRGEWIQPVTGGYFNVNIDTEISEDLSYFRIEAFARQQDPAGDPGISVNCPDAWTNPVFVRRISSPPGSSAFFDQDPDFGFNVEAGRFIPHSAEIVSSEWNERCWRMEFIQPEVVGELRIKSVDIPISFRLNGEPITPFTLNPNELLFPHSNGRHQLEIMYQ